MKKCFLPVMICVLFNLVFSVFSQTNNQGNPYLDESSQKYSELLLVLNRDAIRNYTRTTSAEDRAKRYFELGLNHYNGNRYVESIDNFILACKSDMYIESIIYYYLGLCLMDMRPSAYELAKKSFKEAVYRSGLEATGVYGLYSTWRNLYSYDDNGIKREPYFSYYNIACIESLQNNVDLAYEYLCKALYHGYPYINHIRNDEDLRNLFRDRGRLQSIEAIYNAGSQNTLRGKAFRVYTWGDYSQRIYFYEQNRLRDHIDNGYGERATGATYTIRNYIIFSDIFERVDGYTYIKRFENWRDSYVHTGNTIGPAEYVYEIEEISPRGL